ncbi:hypothetical protein WN48_05411 [Eufriesea mexicana]|nr:hypothetical protein WN48_05411 [Eufriesea mexicana]
MTPKKRIKLENLEDSKDVQIENINSSQNYSLSNLGINLIELPQETQCKEERLYSCNIDTPNKKTKRNLSSDIGDYDQLPDMVKNELYNDELNDIEAIDMLHDLSSMMDFEESKVSIDIFCSTMNNPIHEENITELSKDAEVDPLFIDNNDSTNIENIENQEIKYKDTMLSSNIQEGECFTNKTNVANNTERNRKHKSNKKDTDLDYDHIKYILGELDIELTSNEEETLDEAAEDTINALYNLNVKLMHEVPIQHDIEHTAGSRTLTKKERKLFLNYGPMKNGTYTPNEDTIIRNNWEAFCEQMDYHGEHYIVFTIDLDTCIETMKNVFRASTEVKWTLSSIGKFIKTFMSVTLCETVEDLKDAIIPKLVWQKLEEKLHIDYNVLRTFWIYQLHMQLFCPEPIHLNDIKIKLIEYVYGKGISNTREIVWLDVAKYFDGITSIFLCRTFLYLVQGAIKKKRTNHFPDIIEYLYDEKIQDIKDKLSDKFLPRLSYNNGEIKIIDKYLYEDISIS